MQRIVLCYTKDSSAGALSHGDLRACLQSAAEQAALPVAENRRSLLMGPPLPTGATGEAEQSVLELDEPREPSEVRALLNAHLPDGVHIVQAWIARPGNPDENPGTFDEAVYDVFWPGTLPIETLGAAMRQFLSAGEVSYTRAREKKIQHLNARALVHDVALLAVQDGGFRLRMSLSVGPQGSLRPEELLQIFGCALTDALHVHRLGLLRSSRRNPASISYRRWNW